MAFQRTNNKMLAIKAFINTWLKDDTLYCATCGEHWNADYHKFDSCCNDPKFGRNADHIRAIAKQNKETIELQANDTGTTEDKSIRYGASIPPKLYRDLEAYFKSHGEKFLETPKELHEFLKEFPVFKVCEKV